MKHLIALLIFIGIFSSNNLNANHWEVNHIHKDCILAYVNDGFSSLDFSKIYPKLNRLELFDRKVTSWEPKEKLEYLAQDDAGLSKNINLKVIYAWNDYCQIPISLSYLPSVESFQNFLNGPYHDFDYLSQSLPSLKTLIYSAALEYPKGTSFREKLPIRLNNISKLELLENLTIDTNSDQWGSRTFTDQELEALSKMHRLKNFTLKITYYNKFEKPAFDKETLQILRNLLPNTKVKIDFYLHLPQDD